MSERNVTHLPDADSLSIQEEKYRMTGEMVKPKNAELGQEYWKGRSTSWGSVIGDEGILVRPNYPDIFELSDKLISVGIENRVLPFDVYQGPFVDIPCGVEIWYSCCDSAPGGKWFIKSDVEHMNACDDDEAVEMVLTLLPLERIAQS